MLRVARHMVLRCGRDSGAQRLWRRAERCGLARDRRSLSSSAASSSGDVGGGGKAQRAWDGSQAKIRNFSIIAHVDHGKSTLSDAMLQLAGNLKDALNTQTLDTLNVERERGITVKAQTASFVHYHAPTDTTYLLNLIDTPGHVDFSYEVSRSLAACQGALLLVDATQGVQAQTIANFYLALERDLDFIPVLTKTDLSHADINDVAEQVESAFGLEQESIQTCSGKTGEGVPEILDAIVEGVPPPSGDETAPTRALICDSWFDEHRGVILLVKVEEGQLQAGDRIIAYHAQRAYDVQELGLLLPARKPEKKLSTGQVGYVIANIRSPKDIRLGDTIIAPEKKKTGSSKPTGALSESAVAALIGDAEPLPGFEPSRPMVYAGLFAEQSHTYEQMRDAIDKLTLNDASVTVSTERSTALGVGFRCGFLGMLHMEVFTQRLEEEFGASVIVTAPTVPYEITLKSGEDIVVSSPSEFPDDDLIAEVREPMCMTTIICPTDQHSAVMELCRASRGEPIDASGLGKGRMLLRHRIPLQQIVATGFYNKLKASTSGFASFDYEEAGYFAADLVRVEIRINGEAVDALSAVAHRGNGLVQTARALLLKLKKLISRQNFEIILQACVGPKKILARERIPPFRKDVLTKSGKTVGGGDESRKKKLLEKQKAGKKRLKMVGKVQLSQDVFTAVMRTD